MLNEYSKKESMQINRVLRHFFGTKSESGMPLGGGRNLVCEIVEDLDFDEMGASESRQSFAPVAGTGTTSRFGEQSRFPKTYCFARSMKAAYFS